MMLAAELTGCAAEGAAEQTLLFSTESWATGAADTPAHTPVRGLLEQAGNYTRAMGDGSTLFGAGSTGYGTLALHAGTAPSIGAFGSYMDTISRYGFGWRQVRILAAGEPYDTAPAYPAGWAVLLVASVAAVQRTRTRLVFSLRDRLSLLEKPVCSQYAGTGGEEGSVTLAGRPKPRVYGSVCNAPATAVDASNNIYQVSDKPYTEPHWVWDKRSVLTPTSNAVNEVADFPALQAASVAGGAFSRLSDRGMFKLGAAPSGVLTVDAIRHNASYSPTFGRPRLGEVLVDIATDAGLTSADIDPALASLGVPGASLGYFVQDLNTTYLEVLGAMAHSAGAWVGFNRLGVLTGGFVRAPTGTPVWTFTESNGAEIDLDEGLYPVPLQQVTVRGGYNWTTLSASQLHSSVGEVDRQALGEEYTYAESASNTIATKHLNAPRLTHDTRCGPVGAAAGTVLPGAAVGCTPSTVLGLFGVERLWPRVRVGLSRELLAAVDIGSVVQLRWARYGLGAGQLFNVWKVDIDFRANKAVFWLWG
jgi:hypothetical protein